MWRTTLKRVLYNVAPANMQKAHLGHWQMHADNLPVTQIFTSRHPLNFNLFSSKSGQINTLISFIVTKKRVNALKLMLFSRQKKSTILNGNLSSCPEPSRLKIYSNRGRVGPTIHCRTAWVHTPIWFGFEEFERAQECDCCLKGFPFLPTRYIVCHLYDGGFLPFTYLVGGRIIQINYQHAAGSGEPPCGAF